MAKMTKSEVQDYREIMIDELEEWFLEVEDESGGRPPAWLFFVFEEAAIEIRPMVDPRNDWHPPSAEDRAAAIEQLENANAEQIECYSDARDAWVRL